MTTKQWSRALVTGASSGIGDALARQLAAAGTDLVLVARSRDRMESLAKELTHAHRVDVEVLAADLGDPIELGAVEDRVRDGDVLDLVINNAGFGTQGRFWELDLAGEQSEIDLNISAVVRLSHAALAAMVPRGHGALVNVSSLGSLSPVPMMATYGATKAFVTSFTEALHEELRGTGVTATAVLPGFIRTEFQERAGLSEGAGVPAFAWMTPDAVARDTLVAAAAGKATCVPGLGYRVASGVIAPVPRMLRRRIAGAMAKSF